MTPPPMPEDPRDTDQLRLLVVFHYVYMGLQVAALAILGVHYFIMRTVFEVVEKAPQKAPLVVEEMEKETFPAADVLPPDAVPEEGKILPLETVPAPELPVNPGEFFAGFHSLLIVFYLLGAVFLVAYLVLNFFAARAIKQRKGRLFSMVVAGINCLSFPFGTALGVFTLVVLGRQSVMNSFEREAVQPR